MDDHELLEAKLRSDPVVQRLLKSRQCRGAAEAAIAYYATGKEPLESRHKQTATWATVRGAFDRLKSEGCLTASADGTFQRPTHRSNGESRGPSAINWPFFGVGVALLLIALGFAIWTFYLGNVTADQRLIDLWALPLASAFGAGSFTGSLVSIG